MVDANLNGRCALVTGGASGIGAGIAQALAAAGAGVMIADIDEPSGKDTARALSDGGARSAFVKLDVTSEDDWVKAVTATIDELGGYDILINNAGIEISGLILDCKPADLRRMFDVNVVGSMLGIKHAFAAMKPGGAAGKGGVVLNIASVAATIAFPGIAGYSASKSALDRITRIAAAEAGKLGYGVRVNCVYPGLIPTRMGNQLAVDVADMGLFASVEEAVGAVIALTPSGRLGDVADIADVATFLISDASRFVNGTGLSVDGGMGS